MNDMTQFIQNYGPPGGEEDPPPADCASCTYHPHTRECRRSAPQPGHDEADVIALWNFTRDNARCGSGSTTKAMVLCSDCTQYYQPNDEPIWPDYKQGLPDDWWKGAGLCTSGAPGATSHEGLWTFWKVVSTAPHPKTGLPGGCGDGVSIAKLQEEAARKAEAAEKRKARTPPSLIERGIDE